MSSEANRRLRRWSPDDVIREIQGLNDRTAKRTQKAFPSLYGAAVRHYGSWKEAVVSAGYSYAEIVRRKPPGYWTKTRILEMIQALPTKHSSWVRKNHSALYNASLRVFGSWHGAVSSAGFDYDQIKKGWLPDEDHPHKFKLRT